MNHPQTTWSSQPRKTKVGAAQPRFTRSRSQPVWANRFSLLGQVALVTGGGGQLGREFARGLGEAGAQVIVADQDEVGCRQVCKVLGKSGLSGWPLAMDVASPESVREAFGRMKTQYGGLDILVNNAGIAVFTPFETRAYEEFMRVLRVNVGGTFLCTQAAVDLMKNRPRGGRIVNIGSIYGVVSGDPRLYVDTPRNTSEVYAASKAAVIQMTRYWAVHLAKYRIRVNALSPGGIFNQHDPAFLKAYAARTPLGRMGEVSELLGALLFLATDASSYVTGQNLLVDGGWTVW